VQSILKILLGQLGANGDCLYATVLARQIRHDYPDAHLTWAISSQCRHLIDNNPHVDAIWEWSINDWAAYNTAWQSLERALFRAPQNEAGFDKLVLSQILPSNIRNYDGTVRPSILRAYGAPITVPVDSVIELTDAEQSRVAQFAEQQHLADFEHCVLFECSSKSGQSYVTPKFAVEVARKVHEVLPGCGFVFSTHQSVDESLPYVISARDLTMRENAALTHHCSMFVGCGSGLTVVATSSGARELPNIQVLNASKSVYASFRHDFEYFGKSTSRFVEMGDAKADRVAEAVISVCRDGVAGAKSEFDRPIAVFFEDYISRVEKWAIRHGKYIDAVESLAVTVERYGWNERLLAFGKKRLSRLMPKDPLMMDPLTARKARQSLEQLLASAAD